MKDLWGFNKLDKNDMSGTPHGILQEQAVFFEKKTGDTLFIKVTTRRLKYSSDIEFTLASNFEVVAPALDGYSFTLFTVYSKPERDYPVAIEKNISDRSDFSVSEYNFDYQCNNQEEFIKALGEILSSPDTINIIKNLYSKSHFTS